MPGKNALKRAKYRKIQRAEQRRAEYRARPDVAERMRQRKEQCEKNKLEPYTYLISVIPQGTWVGRIKLPF